MPTTVLQRTFRRLAGHVAELRLNPAVARIVAALLVTGAGCLGMLLLLELAGDLITVRRDRIITILLGFATVVIALPLRRAAWGTVVLVAVWLAAYVAFTTIPAKLFIETPVDVAAGGAAFYGTPYIPQQVAAVVVQALIFAAGLSYVIMTGRTSGERSFPARTDGTGDAAPGSYGSRSGHVVVALGTAILALTMVPDIAGHALGDPLAGLKANNQLATWDLENLLTWQWLINTGAVPMRDFFWPYGHTWVFQLFPLGPLWAWISQVAVLVLAAWALWRLSPPEGRALRVVACLAVLPLLGVWQGGVWRYALPLVLAVTYAAVGPARHTRPTGGHVVLAVAALYAALYGIDILILGVTGMGFVLAGELLGRRVEWRPRAVFRALAVDALPLLAVVFVPLLWIAMGSAAGNVRFAFGLRGVSSASAAGQHMLGALAQNIAIRPTLDMLYVALAALLLASGLLHVFVGDRHRSLAISRLLLAASGAWFALTLKHLVRPQGELMLLVPLVALSWCAIMVWTTRRLLVAAFVGALFVTFIFMLERSDSVTRYLDSAWQAPERVTENVKLLSRQSEVARTARRQFSRRNLPAWPLERAMAAQLESVITRVPNKSFAVLGDAPFLYVYFDQRPPYHIELYDAAKRDEQQVMVDTLARQRPAYVVWRRDFSQDVVPQSVRNPIVLNYVVANYVPASLGEVADVLRRRRFDEVIDVNYWRGRLLDTDVGFVAASSNAEDATPCQSGDGCVKYAVLEGRPKRHGEQVVLRISGRGGSFRVLVRSVAGENEYPVRLDRLWFRHLLGQAPRVTAETPAWRARLAGYHSGDALW